MMHDKAKIAISVSTNFSYLHNLHTLLLSRDSTQKTEIDIYVMAVNVPRTFEKVYKQNFKNIYFDFVYKTFEDINAERAYMSSLRIDNLNKLAKTNYDYIGYLDVNTILVSDITQLLETNYDVFIAIDEEHKFFNSLPFYSVPVGPLGTPYFGVCLGGVQIYRNNRTTQEFLLFYMRICKDHLLDWFSDQEGLYLTYKAFSEKLRVLNIIKHIALKRITSQTIFIYEKKGTHELFHKNQQTLLLQNASAIPSEIIASKQKNQKAINKKSYLIFRFVERVNFMIDKFISRIFPMKNKIKIIFYRFYFLILRNIFLQSSWKFQLKYFPLYLDLKNKGISITLATFKEREVDMTTIIQEELQEGDVCFDLGSNIGFYPALAAQCIGEKGRLVCVEPDIRNIPTLKKNINLINPSIKTSLLNIAISSTSTKKYLHQTTQTNLNVLYDAPNGKSDYSLVECLTTDDLADKIGIKPDFIRMDIEGHEVSALAGMKKLIRSSKKLKIFFELHPNLYGLNNDIKKELEVLFDNNFLCKYMISSGKSVPTEYLQRGYLPNRIFESDGFNRGLFQDLSREDAIFFATAMPKLARYIFLERR